MAHDLDRATDDFHDRLYAHTPRAWATAAIIAVNVAVYLAMLARGQNGWWADVRALVAWGANTGALTRAEWWRLVAAAFLHGGLLHLALNMVALRSGGPLLERSIGSARYLAVYLLAAIASSAVSVLAREHGVSVGASGAVFGVYGALLGIALHHAPPAERWTYLRPAWAPSRRPPEADAARPAGSDAVGIMPAHLARLLAAQIVGLVILNLLIGLAIPVIDNAAHVSGFVTGLALGWLAAGAVSARLASPAAGDGAPGGRVVADRSGWFVPVASAIVVVLALNAAFPLMPASVRMGILETGCRARVGGACLAAGLELQKTARGRPVPAALEYFDRGCRAGHGPSCTAVAAAALVSPGGEKKAVDAFAAACRLEDVAGCRALGVLLEAGKGVAANAARAMEVYARACDRNDAFSCVRLAEGSLQGRGVARDPRRAATLARRACDLGEPRGCTLVGAELAASKDVGGAIRFFERACASGEPLACTELGSRYEAGNGVRRDPKAAAERFARACSAGFGPACMRGGLLFERTEGVIDLGRAAGQYEIGCRLGRADACFNAGVMYAEGRGRDRNLAKALAFYEQACRRGLTQVCALVEQMRREMPSDGAR